MCVTTVLEITRQPPRTRGSFNLVPIKRTAGRNWREGYCEGGGVISNDIDSL